MKKQTYLKLLKVKNSCVSGLQTDPKLLLLTLNLFSDFCQAIFKWTRIYLFKVSAGIFWACTSTHWKKVADTYFFLF